MRHTFSQCLNDFGNTPEDLTTARGFAIQTFIQQIGRHRDEIAPRAERQFYSTTDAELRLESIEVLREVLDVPQLTSSTYSKLLAILTDARERSVKNELVALPLSRIFDFAKRQLGAKVLTPDYVQYPNEIDRKEPLDEMGWHQLIAIENHYDALTDRNFFEKPFPGANHRFQDLLQAARPLFHFIDPHLDESEVKLFMDWAAQLLKQQLEECSVPTHV